MLRGLILLAMAGPVAFVALPFVMASRALDEHGIALRGRVYHKSETVRLRYSGWDCLREVTVEYPLPETGGVSFFGVPLDAQEYDAFRVNQPVEVRYLLRRDVPDLPLAGFLWELRALPLVRLAGSHGHSRMKAFATPRAMQAAKFLAVLAVLVILWRITRSSFIGWAAAIGIAAGLVWLFVVDFPRPTPPPAVAVRRGTGQVKSIGRIDTLFSTSRRRGLTADQPIDVVAVEFVPEGRTEPVVAVDLIDRGSLPGLRERSTAPIRYEAASPRTAYLEGATRTFPARNLRGAVVQCGLSLALLLGALAVAQWIGRAWKRLIARRLQSLPGDRQ